MTRGSVANGWEVERRPHRPGEGDPSQLGDLVIGRLRGTGGPNVLLVGHMDTVFDEGTVAERPFRIDGDIARGPGVSDMKGGLLTGFVATEVLQEAGFDGFGTITYVCNPDEEIGSPFSGPVIRELAPQHDAAFVLEGRGRTATSSRRARGSPTSGSTITAARRTPASNPRRVGTRCWRPRTRSSRCKALNGRWPGVTVNVGVVQGGTRTNVVPERCELQVTCGHPRSRRSRRPRREIERICAEHVVPDVITEVVGHGWHRPMEKKEGADRLVKSRSGSRGARVRAAGRGDRRGIRRQHHVARPARPTIDGLGPVGGDDHAPAEWLDLSSVVPRVALLAGLISRV